LLSSDAYTIFLYSVGNEGDMSKYPLTPELLDLVAERFKALAEPARLRILSALREGEKTVSELMEETGLGQANVSKHLQLLYSLGFVERRKEGLYVHYRLASEDVFQLCDLMCGRLEAEARARRELLSGA
jgi:DNA-binding transcriptional ArsR family regulator